ncbi:MAG: DUF1905 domain-containing protein [Pseudomonadota bacterium]
MSEEVTAALPLTRWQGDRGTYHLVTFNGTEAEALSAHALMHRLEFGHGRGFGSVKVTARIGDTSWRSSVFPQKKQSEWVLLVSKRVMKAEGLDAGDTIDIAVEPI